MKTSKIEVKFNYWPKQLAACDAANTHKYTLFGGVAGTREEPVDPLVFAGISFTGAARMD